MLLVALTLIQKCLNKCETALPNFDKRMERGQEEHAIREQQGVGLPAMLQWQMLTLFILVPIAFQARPTQIAYPSPAVTPSIASCSGYGLWGGHQSPPLNEIAAWRHRFQLTLQNQLGMEAHQQPQMGPELHLLPLSDMSDAGTSSFEQQLPLASRSDINLELQLGTKPPSWCS